jgi:hypothetical protein
VRERESFFPPLPLAACFISRWYVSSPSLCISSILYALNKTRFVKSHGKYSEEDLDINLSHKVPVTLTNKTAFFTVKCVRLVFDTGERGSSLGISSGCSAN